MRRMPVIFPLVLLASAVPAEGCWFRLRCHRPAPLMRCPAPAYHAPAYRATVTTQTTATVATVQTTTTTTSDLGGFLGLLNAHRGRYGLPPCGVDGGLCSEAVVNNSHQRARGLGHWWMGSARRQTAAISSSTSQVFQQWASSPAHNAAMLDPSIRWIGIASDGSFWTANFR